MADRALNGLPVLHFPITGTKDLLVFDDTTNVGAKVDYETLADDILDKLTEKEFTYASASEQTIPAAIDELSSGKVDVAQGSGNAGKALVVNASGNVEPGDIAIDIDDTLTQQGEAADAKAVGDAISPINDIAASINNNINNGFLIDDQTVINHYAFSKDQTLTTGGISFISSTDGSITINGSYTTFLTRYIKEDGGLTSQTASTKTINLKAGKEYQIWFEVISGSFTGISTALFRVIKKADSSVLVELKTGSPNAVIVYTPPEDVDVALAITGGGNDRTYSNYKLQPHLEETVDMMSNIDITHSINGVLLTSSDNFNTIVQPGCYYYTADSIPNNAPSTQPARVIVIKNPNTYDLQWQMAVTRNNVMHYRMYHNSDVGWSAWEQYNPAYNLKISTSMLTASDDMNGIQRSGIYAYTSSSVPANAPNSLPGQSRVWVVKPSGSTSHIGEWQIIINEGIIYSRSLGSNGEWTHWSTPEESHLLPTYQTETIPYNAVLYHQKWNDLIENKVLRRIDLGLVDNDPSLPIYAYEFAPQRNFVGLTASGEGSTPVNFDWTNACYQRPKMLLMGGVHGNEKCTPMDILNIVKKLKTREYNEIAVKFDWYFLPLMNPWGYNHARLDANGDIIYDNTGIGQEAEIVECTEEINAGCRNNGHGQNINRDWSDVTYTSGGITYGFQTPELQLIKNYVLDIKPDFFIDAHQNHTNKTVGTTPVCCHAGAPVDGNNSDESYQALMRKIYRYIDIANADTDETMIKYATDMGISAKAWQACRIWPTVLVANSEHYFSGVTALSGSKVIGNTQHTDIVTPYSICTETSEICATYAQTPEWYNPVACTFSCTYLWNVIKQISKLF